MIDKVPSSYVGARAAQLNRYAAAVRVFARSILAGFLVVGFWVAMIWVTSVNFPAEGPDGSLVYLRHGELSAT